MTTESKNIIVEGTPETAASRAADLFASLTLEAVNQRGSGTLALSGGTTPRTMYQVLAERALTGDVPWGQLDIFFGDERDVPHDDVESNYHMAQRALLDHVPVDWSRLHPMRADAEDLDAAAREYERIIRDVVPSEDTFPPRFDLLLLGMGGDGHVASLFPDTDALGENERLVMSYFVPVLGRNRMTITYPLINAARHILMLVTGDDKAEIVQQVFGQQGPAESTLPVSRVSPWDGTLHVVLDHAAARLL